MTNTRELEIALIKAQLSKNAFADALGISIQALYNKLNNKAEFKASEIIRSCEVLKLSVEQRERIFFASNVEKKSTKR